MRKVSASVASLAALGVAVVLAAVGAPDAATERGGAGDGPRPRFAAQGGDRGPLSTTRVALRADDDAPAPGARPGSEKVASPLALTASDGSGLRLVSLAVEASVAAPLAFTEVRMVFENPEPRVREGTFTARLPPGASVARFAMKIDGRWQEGEVVEKQAARRVYEDFLHRRQDPALLEEGLGNQFSARVFPIPPRGRKEIVLSYASRVGGGEPYRVGLRGLPSLESLAVHVARRGRADVSYRVDEARFRPGEDLVLPDDDVAAGAGGGAAAEAARASGVRGGDAVAVRARVTRVEAPAQPLDGRETVAVLVDTSASRGLDLRDAVRATRELLASLPAAVRVHVRAFDQDVAEVYLGAAGGFGEAQANALLARGALGASDLGFALDDLAATLGRGAEPARVVLVTDGVATVGARTAAELRAKVAPLRQAGVSRLDVLAVGGLRDEASLVALARGGLVHDGVVIDGARGATEVRARLERGTSSNVAVAVEGARFVWPSRLDGVQPGDEVTVLADLPAGSPVRLTVGDETYRPDVRSAPPELVGRALGEARLAALGQELESAGDPSTQAALRDRAVGIARAHRIVSAFTSLLVLETEQDYARYGIDRSQRLAVLGVVDGRVQRLEVERGGEPSARTNAKGEEAEARTADVESRTGRDDGRDKEGGRGTRAHGDEGSLGRAPEPRRDEAAEFGMIGILPAGDAFGAGGLGLSGISESSGGQGYVVGPAQATGGRPTGYPSPRPVRPADLAPWGREADVDDPNEALRLAPYEGRFAEVMRELAAGRRDAAAGVAKAMLDAAPSDLVALVAVGEVAEAQRDLVRAARAYGSIVDLFGFRADLRRYAGERLERLADPRARAVARDAFKVAAADRPDHPAGARLFAYALVREGRFAEAFDVLAQAHARRAPEGRFRGVPQILAEDLGLVAAAWQKAEPARAAEIAGRLAAAGGTAETGPSLRFVLVWETDANDVDFHVKDGKGNHAFYGQPTLASGGTLYADVTTGYGPECFTVRGPAAQRAWPYRLSAHYFRRGPMGFGMGTLHVVEHDGKGTLRVDTRPYLVMRDGATVDLGTVRPTSS